MDYLPSEPLGKPQNTGVGSLSLLWGIFPIQESSIERQGVGNSEPEDLEDGGCVPKNRLPQVRIQIHFILKGEGMCAAVANILVPESFVLAADLVRYRSSCACEPPTKLLLPVPQPFISV